MSPLDGRKESWLRRQHERDGLKPGVKLPHCIELYVTKEIATQKYCVNSVISVLNSAINIQRYKLFVGLVNYVSMEPAERVLKFWYL